jgi:hypothetical protein
MENSTNNFTNSDFINLRYTDSKFVINYGLPVSHYQPGKSFGFVIKLGTIKEVKEKILELVSKSHAKEIYLGSKLTSGLETYKEVEKDRIKRLVSALNRESKEQSKDITFKLAA